MIFVEKEKRVGELVLVAVLVALFLFLPFRFLRIAVTALLLIRFLALLYNGVIPVFLQCSRKRNVIYANCNQSFELEYTIINRSFLPVFLAIIRDTVSSGIILEGHDAVQVTLKPFEVKTIRYNAVCRTRGLYKAGPLVVRGSDPFRIFSYRKKIECQADLVIYPAVYRLDLLLQTGLPSGSIQVNNKLYEDLTRYSAIREYQPGDEMKRINWKATARMGKLFSMEYQPSIYFPAVIVVNGCEEDYPLRERENLLNRITEVAASLVFFTVRIKQEMGFITTGKDGESGERPVAPVKAGYGNAVHILEILSKLQLSSDYVNPGEFLFKSGISIPNGAKVLLVSPPLKEEEALVLMGHRKRGLQVELFEVHSRHMSSKNQFAHDLKTHQIREYGEELIDAR